MSRMYFISLAVFLLPTGVFAAQTKIVAPASFQAAQSLVAASSSPGNAYVIGASVVLTAPVAGDFSAFGGSIITAAPVAGDDLMLGGSISSRAPVAGDFRALGGNIDTTAPIAGDLIAVAFSVHDTGRSGGSVFIVAGNTTLSNGAGGPVTIYGNNVALAGNFSGNVHVVGWGHLALAPGTTIHGKLSYEAPEPATIPSSAVIAGGVAYTNASYLPNVGTSRILAFASIGFFLIVRIIGGLILAGLLAGLFPAFAETVLNRISKDRVRDMLLTLLLGFAILVATPIVIVLLALTFVGAGLAILILILYALLLLLALLYAGIIAGGLLMRRLQNRERIVWHDGVIGMTLLLLFALVPIIGLPVVLLLSLFVAGTLLQLFFQFAFPHEETVVDITSLH
ncbi:MAG TPA: hypothetical protein VMV38_00280 [Candidatus Paceibacterota bacterium]|nr:hypothetical protein [Candidatus Paceibacterota bacterium]